MATDVTISGGPEDRLGSDRASCTLGVEGMDCSSCAESVSKALRGLEGVEDVRVDVVGGRVTIRYAEGKLVRGDLIGAVRRVGYRVKEDAPVRREVFEVPELHCSEEVRQIERGLGDLPGVARIDVDLVRRRVTVEGEITGPEIQRAIGLLGMTPRRIGAERITVSWWERRGRLAMTALAGILWVGSMLTLYAWPMEEVAAALAIGAIVTGGWFIVPRGLRAARNGSLDMNFLITIAAVGALFIGEYAEAATAMFLFAVAQLLETYAMDRARNAIKGLMDLSPASATVLRGGVEARVPVEEVDIGELVVLRPGERVPVDGAVEQGRSTINEAPITGESVPVEKGPGAEVYAGTVNGEGALEVRSTRAAEDTTLARIIHSVEEAQASRAPSQTFVDRFAQVYTPAVVVAALLLAVVPPLAGFGAWGEWIYRALVLLVVACPCALVISTPVTIVSALTGAARRGILIKGGLHLENVGRGCVVALDKTGTLTEGEPSVQELIPIGGATETDLLRRAAAAETRSEHPIARAILQLARRRHVHGPSGQDVLALPGLGVRARVGEEIVFLGSERLFRDMGTELGAVEEISRELETRGRTVVLVGIRDADRETAPTVIGLIGIADRIRDQAPQALADLRAAGVSRIVMLTGDNAGTARAVSEALGPGGLDEFRAGLLPDDKVLAVKELRNTYGRVVFVGDGVNDAPALAVSDVGVAMGSAGTDVALETADVALMGDDLGQLPVAVRMARKAEGIIRWNIGFSLLTKAAFVALAVLGYATLWMAVAADMGTSLIVIFNGLRALRT